MSKRKKKAYSLCKLIETIELFVRTNLNFMTTNEHLLGNFRARASILCTDMSVLIIPTTNL